MILERDLGLEISRATLDGHQKVGEVLIPMWAGERITKRISGNTVAPEELWCSTSV